MTKNSPLIGTKLHRGDGWDLGLAHIMQNGRSWALVAIDEDRIITDVFYAGARAKVTQQAAMLTGCMVYFWYECITELCSDSVKLTPHQVSQVARLSYAEMVTLNIRLAESAGQDLTPCLNRLAYCPWLELV